MRRKKKELNQNINVEQLKKEVAKTPIEEPQVKIVIDGDPIAKMEELHDIDIVDEMKEIDEVETQLPPDLVDHPELFAGDAISENWEEKKEPKVDEVQQLTIIKPSKAQLAKLSKSGLRWYLRTGILPK